MSTGNGDSLLARWSRRKHEARLQQDAAAELETTAGSAAAAAPPAAEATPAPATEQPPLTDADMPAIETLTEDSDFSPFMSPGVSEALRNRALRKLFAGAAFNLRDGLDDYDEDYSSFAKLGDIVTSDMKHRVEMEQEKLRQRLAEESAGEAGETPGDTAPGEADSTDVDSDAAVDAEPGETTQLAHNETEEHSRPDE